MSTTAIKEGNSQLDRHIHITISNDWNMMIVFQLSSTGEVSLHRRYALGLIYLLLAAHQLLIIKADLNGVEACQNRCFDQSECGRVGNRLCCQWDDDIGQCISSIHSDICPGTATMQPPPDLSTDCPPTAMSLVVVSSTRRNLSNIQAESAPSTSPTIYGDRPCMNIETSLDRYLCLGFTKPQLKTQIITCKISAALSALGSSYIVQDVLRDPKKRSESTYHRIMLGISCSDILFSFFCPFLGTWVMPEGEQVMAFGSNAACNAAGFFSSIGWISTLLYTCSLATFYILKLKYSWVNSKIKDIEKWLLFLPFTMGLIYAISAAATSKLGPYGSACS